MIQEEKDLLIKDLCARAPYDTIVSVAYWVSTSNGKFKLEWDKKKLTISLLHQIEEEEGAWEFVKPYLRPMSSMTEEEKKEYCDLQSRFLLSSQYPVTDAYALFDWFNAHHFDYRGLIPIGLAIEVTKENNPYEE